MQFLANATFSRSKKSHKARTLCIFEGECFASISAKKGGFTTAPLSPPPSVPLVPTALLWIKQGGFFALLHDRRKKQVLDSPTLTQYFLSQLKSYWIKMFPSIVLKKYTSNPVFWLFSEQAISFSNFMLCSRIFLRKTNKLLNSTLVDQSKGKWNVD